MCSDTLQCLAIMHTLQRATCNAFTHTHTSVLTLTCLTPAIPFFLSFLKGLKIGEVVSTLDFYYEANSNKLNDE